MKAEKIKNIPKFIKNLNTNCLSFETIDGIPIFAVATKNGDSFEVDVSHYPKATNAVDHYITSQCLGDTPEEAISNMFNAWQTQYFNYPFEEIEWCKNDLFLKI